MKYYLVGIKGTGMSALAQCLKDMKETVMGSDKEEYYFTENNLNKNNIPILKFNKNNINKYNDYIYIISYAYDENNNEEVKEILENNKIYFYYSDFINNYFKQTKIGISGTHGKTTTTTLIKTLFDEKNISYIIGDGNGGGIKGAKYLIFEACEYRQHFLNYDYDYLIINNIDYDHPDYYNNLKEVIKAFKKVSKKTKKLIINNDDANCKEVEHMNKYTFGINNKSYVTGKILNEYDNGYKIEVEVEDKTFIFDLPFVGIHMVYNFISAFTMYYLIYNEKNNIDIYINKKLKKYCAPQRRKQEIVLNNGNILVDDYAHHPKEIEMTYQAIKQKFPTYDISIVFQPHTYTRTIFLNEEFKEVFKNKKVYIMKTFTSREEYDVIKEGIVKEVFKEQEEYKIKKMIEIIKKENQIIIFMGAGNINEEISKLCNCKL